MFKWEESMRSILSDRPMSPLKIFVVERVNPIYKNQYLSKESEDALARS